MRFPRMLLAVPLVAAGMWLPAFTAPPQDAAAHVIGMTHEGFVVDGKETVGADPTITISAGQSLTFQNSSRWIHIVGAGENGLLAPAGAGAIRSRFMVQQDEAYTTAPWQTPGEYPITCPVHPDMNATVVVQP
jgi:plastocyanin